MLTMVCSTTWRILIDVPVRPLRRLVEFTVGGLLMGRDHSPSTYPSGDSAGSRRGRGGPSSTWSQPSGTSLAMSNRPSRARAIAPVRALTTREAVDWDKPGKRWEGQVSWCGVLPVRW